MPLEARDVWFYYRRGRWVLRGVSVRLEKGSKLVILGPNGSGKTTLLRILGLLEKPQRGIVVVDGVECGGGCPASIRRRVVYVHPEPVMLRGSVLYNLAIGLLLRGYDEEDAFEEARSLLRELGLESLEDEQASKLSMGQRMLIHILRAILLKPDYLLLDEPTVYLDRAKRRLLVGLVERLVEDGSGVAVATHDEWLVETLKGEVFELGSAGAHSSTSARGPR